MIDTNRKNIQIRSTILLLMVVLILSLTSNLLFPKHKDLAQEFKNVLKSGETIIDYVKDGNLVYLLISSDGRRDYGDLFILLRYEDANWKRVYENDFEELHPWKIELSDIDGDGTREILTAVYKTAHYDQELKNRLFILNYQNGVLTKKWTGSQFAGEWIDFYSGELLNIPGQELMFIENAGEGMEKLSVYYWFDFGFVKLAESDSFKDIRNLSIEEENLIQITYDKKQKITLSVKDGKIVEVITGKMK